MASFTGLNTQVLGISIDHVPALIAWAESLGGINFPLLSDFWPHGEVAKLYAVLRTEGFTERAIFLIDKEGVLRWRKVYDQDEQPDNREVLAEIRKIDPQASAAFPEVEPDSVPLPSGGIIMYCTPYCLTCRKAATWLEERDLDYQRIDVYRVPGAIQQVREWADGNLVTPTFDVDGTIVIDFDEERLAELLGVEP
jgi:glutaredoxin